MDSKSDVQDIELVDIEDIVPFGGNSLFLCLARVLIYMSQKSPQLANGLNLCVNLNKMDLKSDIHLQNVLRIRLCEYWLKTGIFFDDKKKLFSLAKEFTSHFNNNIYDFLIQVYQMSINNFSNNSLYKKYALNSLAKMLKVRIYYKKSNGQWKCFSPNKRQIVEKREISLENQNIIDLAEYLNTQTIYLQEFKYECNQNSIYVNKNIRFLLDKKLWLMNHQENGKICMKFSQFNDSTELKLYQDEYFLIDSKRIIQIFMSQFDDINLFEKVFCVFIYKVPVDIILKGYQASSNQSLFYNKEKLGFDFSPEFNTIGKQIYKLEQLNTLDENLFIKYMNYLWSESGVDGAKFTKETVNKYFKRLISNLI